MNIMKAHVVFRLGICVLAILCSFYSYATTVTVSTLDFAGPGSLNEAITTINANSGPHTIDFSVTGTITLDNFLPIITQDVTIEGLDIIIDGAFSYQAFKIEASATVIINDITIQRAAFPTGSAIVNRGTLNLNRVTLSGNRSSDRGGAIYNQNGTMNITDCLISNNKGGDTGGGGIYNLALGSITAINTTITGNLTFGIGGGIFNAGFMTLIHSTISKNIASSTEFSPSNTGGGIYNIGNLTLENNIVYNNGIGLFNSPQDIFTSAGVTQPNPNLVGTCAGSCPSFAMASDPLLTPLADNGGAMPTMALQSSSPAIDAGSGTVSTDQRGMYRDPNPDLGAFEFGASLTSPASVELAIKAYLRGPYDTSDMRDDIRSILPTNDPYGLGATTTAAVLSVSGTDAIVDWIVVEVRPTATPTMLEEQQAALIQRDGDIVATDGVSNITFSDLTSGTYYVSIRHRNHLGAMALVTVTVP